MIDHKRCLLFVHIARTGGTSIEAALVGKDWWTIDPETKHLSASQMRRHFGEDIWGRYLKFAVVRNPWDRVVSMWATKWWHQNIDETKYDDMKEFILQLELHKNEKYNSVFYHEIIDEEIDYVLRFEDLQADFSSMLSGAGLADIVLPHVEKRSRTHYRDYYDAETAELLGVIFRKDIELYGYRF